jgi:hypothetical protein
MSHSSLPQSTKSQSSRNPQVCVQTVCASACIHRTTLFKKGVEQTRWFQLNFCDSNAFFWSLFCGEVANNPGNVFVSRPPAQKYIHFNLPESFLPSTHIRLSKKFVHFRATQTASDTNFVDLHFVAFSPRELPLSTQRQKVENANRVWTHAVRQNLKFTTTSNSLNSIDSIK